MADVFTRGKRSAIMASIRGRGNRSTELALAGLFRRQHITGWRRHAALFGRPDFAFPRLRVAAFVDGCFWHGCPKCYRRPSSNRVFWAGKLVRNRARDRLVTRTLRSLGWEVLRIWEHELKQPERLLVRLRLRLTPAVGTWNRRAPRE
jgi:DNA mismatch endonuclease (patch repair protein)